jgi:hypothetical protein
MAHLRTDQRLKAECRRRPAKPARQSSFILYFLSIEFSHLTFLRATAELFDVTMSFGFSVGDFIAVLQLTNDMRKQFVDAPSQFKAISEE